MSGRRKLAMPLLSLASTASSRPVLAGPAKPWSCFSIAWPRRISKYWKAGRSTGSPGVTRSDASKLRGPSELKQTRKAKDDMNQIDLNGQTAVVTGGAQGLGLA